VKRPPFETALRLGRVSNLPTVWTNVAAGMALTGARTLPAGLLALLGLSVSLLYIGGMYLNDAFDARWDADHRPERPIPAGEVRARTVFAAGFAMLGAGVLLVAAGIRGGQHPLIPALALAALILLYDVSHKGNPLAPVIMALCRVAVYVLAARALTAAPLPGVFYLGAGALLLYLVFLSTLARKETLHPRLPKMIGTLVAGISVLDAAVLLLTGHGLGCLVAMAAFLLTLLAQRRVPGS
jgi:4-hydroxybenzoate polyprenyltransferase